MRLFLCEKPSQGKDIARVLGATRQGTGCYSGTGITVTWCIGHLIEAAAPEVYGDEYKRWSLDQLPIIPKVWRSDIKASTAAQYKIVKQLLKQATELVIATDADREGEMIAREVIELCGYNGPIQRLWLSALNDASIRKALGALKPGSETLPLYYSALARSRADWLIGMNLSRLFTLLGRRSGFEGVLSVGRVQTPTLRLVVDRDREIFAFTPTPYWSIAVRLISSESHFLAEWIPPTDTADEAGRCVQEQVAQHAVQSIRTARTARVLSADTERVREAPPLPFDLGTLQEVCSRQLGLDVAETLRIAQSLYETHKATTYPRSDTGYLPENMRREAPVVIKALLAADPALASLIETLDLNLQSRAWNDAKVTAHHGIIPTQAPCQLSALSDKEQAVYAIIRAHYLCQFLPHHTFDRTTVLLEAGEQPLKATGKRVIDPGWHRALRSDAQDNQEEPGAQPSQQLPSLATGTDCSITGTELKALHTKPPKPYTQGELIKAMKTVARLVNDPRLKQILKETTGIGTEATRAGIISGLLDRGYLQKRGRALRATEAAYTLIDVVPEAIADPGTTAIWEQTLDLIEAGDMTLRAFLDKQSAWVTQLVQQYGTLSLDIKLPPSPTCPDCSSPMQRKGGHKGAFWSCVRYPDCKGTRPIAKPLRGKTPRQRRRSTPHS